MGKLVILKLGEGDFEQGFSVILQIGDENARTSTEITGKLQPKPEIKRDYFQWQSIYRRLKLSSRVKGLRKQIDPVPTLEVCQQVSEEFKVSFNSWLISDSFRPVREKFLEKLSPGDDIRILIQTKDLLLQKLPWHLWDLLERYPKAEIALSAPSYEEVNKVLINSEKVKILAILGNSEGIDTQNDRKTLEQLPNADITFLVEPERGDICARLWEQNWQILFFAGHSTTQEDETGKIYINQTESLTIGELKFALKKAVERGLQLAIFNSCDGLGLAREFADLNIPQIIVMREPVPDLVAQEFLKSFLETFSRGESFYLAVREARERLQGLEHKFPCATWLPIICQNPAELPLCWRDLCINPVVETSKLPDNTEKSSRKHRLTLSLILPITIAVTGLLLGIRYLGMLQSWEIKAFDYLMQMRPHELQDSRLLVVKVTEEDVKAQKSEPRRGSLSDKYLAQLLEKLAVHQPAAIGLDIYRDYPASKDYPELAKRMQQSNFVGICKVSNSEGKFGVAPPPEASQDYLGFSDILADEDSVVRRHYLALDPPPSSPCNTPYAFSVRLALNYLGKKGIKLKFTPEGLWQLGKLKFKPLENHTGGYQRIDASGHQILLNYRSSPSPDKIVRQISVGDVLAGKLNPSAVKDKIIIIGTTAETFKDYSLTPYNIRGKSRIIPGVVLQAQMVSQLLSAVLDERPLIWTWSIWGEVIWIWGFSLTGGLIAFYLRKPIYLVIAVGTGLTIVYLSSLILLSSSGCWVPLVPAGLAFLGSNLIVKTSQKSLSQAMESRE